MVWLLVSGEINLLCYVGRHKERYFWNLSRFCDLKMGRYKEGL